MLERYRSSIPRKAFAEAMERVIELVLGPGECPAKSDCPGLVILRAPNMDAEHMAQLICGACLPFSLESGDFTCDKYNCKSCWEAWLTTGKPPQEETEAVECSHSRIPLCFGH